MEIFNSVVSGKVVYIYGVELALGILDQVDSKEGEAQLPRQGLAQPLDLSGFATIGNHWRDFGDMVWGLGCRVGGFGRGLQNFAAARRSSSGSRVQGVGCGV